MPATRRRRLGLIESELELTTPKLAMMFQIFTRLTAGERPNGAERLPGPGRLALRSALSSKGWRSVAGWPSVAGGLSAGWRAVPRRPEFVVLLMFAAVIATVMVAARQSGPALRQCQLASASAQSQPGPPAWYRVPAASAGPRCPGYLTNK